MSMEGGTPGKELKFHKDLDTFQYINRYITADGIDGESSTVLTEDSGTSTIEVIFDIHSEQKMSIYTL